MQEKRNEKQYLVQVCCQRFQEAKSEAAAIAAKRRSEFDALLDKIYSLDEDKQPHIGQLYKLANSTVARGNEEIARLAEKFGIGLHFSPLLTISDSDWGHYVHDFSKNDRRIAERRISRLEREAAAQIERTSMDTLIRLMDEHLAPDEATALVQAIPAAAELVPELKREDLKGEPVHAGDTKHALDPDDFPF
jgi:hypothetical protein